MALAQNEVPKVAVVPMEFFNRLSREEKITIEEAARNKNFRESIRSIIGYSKLRVEHAINKQVVQEFISLGIVCFGTTVKAAKIHLIDFLERHVELRDEDPEKCFWKVAYYFSYCFRNNLPFD